VFVCDDEGQNNANSASLSPFIFCESESIHQAPYAKSTTRAIASLVMANPIKSPFCTFQLIWKTVVPKKRVACTTGTSRAPGPSSKSVKGDIDPLEGDDDIKSFVVGSSVTWIRCSFDKTAR